MKIGIDARFVGPQGTGLGKYAEKLITHLVKIDRNNFYVIFLKKNNWDYLDLGEYKNFKKVLADIPWYSLQEQVKLPKIFSDENLDLLHIPHFNVPIFYFGKFVVTIHDLIHHHFQEQATTTRNPIIFRLKRLGYNAVINIAVKKSTKILVPSNFVKNEVVRTFKINPQKVVVTHEAAEEEYFQNGKGQMANGKWLEKYNIKQPFAIYVGNAYPHKNLNRLLDAVNLLGHFRGESSLHFPGGGNLQLVIVSPRDVFTEKLQQEIKKRNLENHVKLLGYQTADNLAMIFQKAAAYISPSLSEGFGIPGLNAMATGLPVIASAIPTLEEVYGEAALYFDPQNPYDIAEKIKEVLTFPKLRKKLIANGQEQVKKYSWQKMAQETLKVYQEVASQQTKTNF
ncbi:glycosyltransferase family 4 protein [Candidatus Curtissbacteria bacterium]|nr:glycosyltransferase family 4 protein [Candidatus Curtissbacteria bacterium]